jgi:ferredoxin-NADP reductase
VDGRIIEKDHPDASSVRLRMHVPDRPRMRPGQHYLIRLRAPDGYTAQRSYSVASDDEDPLLEFLIERLPGGEVSEFLADVAEVGDELELRGPIGRWFVWDGQQRALCVVGGTGVVPAISMLRTARRLRASDRVQVLAVGRDPSTLPYASELEAAGAHLAFTRHSTTDRAAGPLTADELKPFTVGKEVVFVCGSGRFAEFAESLLLDVGVAPELIRVERFGPTM